MSPIIDHIGDLELMKLSKTAFLCSREIPAAVVLKCHGWAVQQREQGRCVISGFHSRIEKDVFHFLLKGNQPVIMALARGLPKRIAPELKPHIETGRLLIVTIFEKSVKRADERTAGLRNRFMTEQADEIVVGYVRPNGMLEKLLKNIPGRNIKRFDR